MSEPRPQVAKVFANVQGAIETRKIKVRNIDAKTVHPNDLKTLFSKSGPLMSADFDKNTHGQFLGSATLVYASASGAANCIRTYNGAQLDDRVMKIEYAFPQSAMPHTVVQRAGKALKIQKAGNKTPRIRKGINAIKKQGGAGAKKAGKTLVLMGNKRKLNKKRAKGGDAGTGAGGNKKKGRFRKKNFN